MSQYLRSVLCILVLSVAADAQHSMAGEVIEVIDGKTVVLQLSSSRLKVELQYIEVPRPGHEMYARVVHHLRQLVMGKVVEYRPRFISDDRSVGRILVRDADISQQMLRDGAAWHVAIEVSGQERSEFDRYAALAATAKNENRGLWSMDEKRTPWEIRASNIAKTAANAVTLNEPVQQRSTTTKPRGKWGDVNPALGNVGALVHGFNAESQMGYLSTSHLGVTEIGDVRSADRKGMAVDFTYFYKENGTNGRKGTFYLTIVSGGSNWRYAKNNNLTFLGESAVIARAARTTYIDRDRVQWEQLRYELPRKAMERIVNGGNVRLSIGSEFIQPFSGVQHLLYNMLQLSK